MSDDAWTVETLKEHFEALRDADQRALAIKESADLRALELDREIRAYKDEKANDLRSQIERERGNYPSRAEIDAVEEKIMAALKPVQEYVIAQQGGPRAITAPMVVAVLAAVALLAGLYFGLRGQRAASPQTATVTGPVPH